MTIDYKKQFTNRKSHARSVEEVLDSSLFRELDQYQTAGISLWLNGKESSSYGIANYIREEADFMRDYYLDHNNQICGIGFDQIRKNSSRQSSFPEHKA